MKKLLIICVLLILAGCNHNPVVNPDRQIRVDSTLLLPCAALPNKRINIIDEALLENLELYEAYALCSNKQDTSIKVIKELANIKE